MSLFELHSFDWKKLIRTLRNYKMNKYTVCPMLSTN